MAIAVLLWGTVAGIIHFVFLGAAYGNPIVDRVYVAAGERSAAVRQWPSRPRYLLTQFLGTQAEVYLLAIGFVWLRPLVPVHGLPGALLLGFLFAALRVYPRFWNMWIQTTYPRRLLGIEAGAGFAGTLVVIAALHFLVPA